MRVKFQNDVMANFVVQSRLEEMSHCLTRFGSFRDLSFLLLALRLLLQDHGHIHEVPGSEFRWTAVLLSNFLRSEASPTCYRSRSAEEICNFPQIVQAILAVDSALDLVISFHHHLTLSTKAGIDLE